MSTVRTMLAILIPLAYSALAQPGLRWSDRYDGYSDLDRPEAIHVDNQGNVYVTGWSSHPSQSHDCVTVKYDAVGNRLWVARWDGPQHYGDYGSSLDTDAAGNVYVGAYTYLGPRPLLLKYDANGQLLWSRILDNNGAGVAVRVDGSAVYFGASATASGSIRDLVLWKHDLEGGLLWRRSYDGPAASYDNLADIEIDGEGNVYVAGSAGFSTSGDEITLLKYNPAGVQQWLRTYRTPGGYGDQVSDLALDVGGNPVLTGRALINSSTGDQDLLTIKYDTTGNQQWLRRYSGPANGEEFGSRVVCDGDRNVFVAGWSQGVGTGADIVTLKYDVAGVEQWVRRYSGPGDDWDVGSAIGVDDLGRVYVGGYSSQTATHGDMVVLRYSPSGALEFDLLLDGGASGWDGIAAMWVSELGMIVATGSSSSASTGDDYLTLKLSNECVGDLDGDNAVDLADLGRILAHFGEPSGADLSDGDIDGDGDVDLADLATLLTWFGVACP
jgi:hypothetical protein